MSYSLRRLLFGNPLSTDRLQTEKVGLLVGLAVLASDALSSVAYATEEILLALERAGTAGLPYTLPVGIAIACLIIIVATSYRQTIMEYPDGGGAYRVAHENLGPVPGLVAGAAMLTDYVLTVAVSVTAGVAAVISALPDLQPYRVLIAVMVIMVVALINLRGVRESGLVFAIPCYGFIASLGVLLLVSVFRVANQGFPPPLPPGSLEVLQPLGWLLVLRAFASGCAALTGIESVANGVRVFKEPSHVRGARVLSILAVLLTVLFIGITWLAHGYSIVPSHHETVVSQIAGKVFGRGWMYYLIQTATFVILFLAANTSFAGFPRLASLLARDSYVPRQLANLGDRLVFNNGILLLTATAIALVIGFRGDTHALIPLYAVGVFLAFTLSQTGLVVRRYRRRPPGWRRGLLINALGAVTTFLVLSILLLVKFTTGAWMIVVLLPVLVLQFLSIKKHYQGVGRLLHITEVEKLPVRPTTVLIPVAGLHRGVLRALRFAAGLGCPAQALHVATDPQVAAKLQKQWQQLQLNIPLIMLESPYRSLVAPVLEYVDQTIAQDTSAFVAIVIPEFVPSHWRHAFLHNQSALLLEFALRSRPNTVLISIRFLLSAAMQEEYEHAQAEAEAAGETPTPAPQPPPPPATEVAPPPPSPPNPGEEQVPPPTSPPA